MKRLNCAIAIGALLACGAASAVPTFVGSWRVDDGPTYVEGESFLSYTGQEAAARLFGGTASDYVISTIDAAVANINHLTWVSVWGCGTVPTDSCGAEVAEGFKMSTGGLYKGTGDTSAYINDWATGPQYRNYAFAVGPVPEPETWGLMLAGLAGLGVMVRHRRR